MRLPAGFVLAAGFVLGVALESTGLAIPVMAFTVGVILLLWLWTEDRRVPVFGLMFLTLVVAGSARVQGTGSYPSGSEALAETSTFEGTVLDVPRHYPTAVYTRLEILAPEESRAWGQLPPFPAVRQGDRVRISGSYTPNEEASFRGFSARRDTTGILAVQELSIEGNSASMPQRWRATLADEITTRLRSRIPEPAGAFATGVILGDDGAMTEATRHSFRVGGLTHMTAVSGVHVGIIAAAILLISKLGFVSRWWMLGLSLPVVWSFAYLVGMRPSVVRASIMLTLLIIANLLGRPRDTLNAVGLAAAAMLLIDPSFRHDVGFQLSVAATSGIALGIFLAGRRSHWHLLWVVPVSAQLATEPLILYHFGYYSLVSPLANILATPFLALTMGMSILTVLVSVISGSVADAIAMGTWISASAVVRIADLAASIPYLSDDIQPISRSVVWAAYAVLGGLVALLFLLLEDSPGEHEGEFSLLYRV